MRWAFAEAAVLFLRHNQPGQEYFAKLEHHHGTAKALTVLAHQLGRAVYDLRTREPAVARQRFVLASPLRGETEPIASLADNRERLCDTPSLDTARTVWEYLDDSPGAVPCEWTVSLAPLLGDASSRVPWLPLHRVWHSRGVSYDTPRCCEKTGTRAQQSFSDVAPAGATVSRGPLSTETVILKRGVGQPTGGDQHLKSSQPQILEWTNHFLFLGRPPAPVVPPSARLTTEA